MTVSLSFICNENIKVPKQFPVVLVPFYLYISPSTYYNSLGFGCKPCGYPLMCIRLYAMMCKLIRICYKQLVKSFGDIK